jgi:hypothetical protein
MNSAPTELSLPRRNCLDAPQEIWRPRPFGSRLTLIGCTIERVRRFLDLQYASIYRDLAHLAAGMQGRLLDVGCGAQPYRHLFSEKCSYQGIDSAGVCNEFGPRSPDTTYFDGDAWPVDNVSVDYVLSTETMEHVLDSSAFLAEAHRCVRPGGYVILTVPFSARWHFIPRDYWRFTPSALEWLLNRSGFRDVKVHARGNSATVVAYKIVCLIAISGLGSRRKGAAIDPGRILGIAALPLLPLAAFLGQISLLFEGGDDCLGYTVVARRPQSTA